MSYYTAEDIRNELSENTKTFAVKTTVDQTSYLKKGIWAYFLLLIFEGALRKWVLPDLANPLLIIRDPIAIYLVIVAWQKGLLRYNIYMASIVIIGIIGIFAALFMGHGNFPVALFGARILILHFPLMFVIGSIFTRADILKVANATMFLSIPMAFLIFLQFSSPQSAWVNRGIGGDIAGSGYSGALGYFRPSGSFSFTTGITLFFSFAAPFICYFWLNLEKTNKILLIASTIALISSIPLSISRSLFFGVAVTLVFTIIAVSRKPKYLKRVIAAAAVIIIALTILNFTSFYSVSTSVFSARFESANEFEGGVQGALMDRFFGGMLTALSSTTEIPFWGNGIGMGTNVGSMLLAGNVTFLISEGEWGRLIGELGPLLGILVVLIRLAFSGTVTIAAYKKLTKGDLLPWLLLSNLLLVVPQGQWAQPTGLGFSTLIGGLIIASFKRPADTTERAV